ELAAAAPVLTPGSAATILSLDVIGDPPYSTWRDGNAVIFTAFSYTHGQEARGEQIGTHSEARRTNQPQQGRSVAGGGCDFLRRKWHYQRGAQERREGTDH